MRRSLLLSLVLVLACLPAAADARPANVIIGLGDQHAQMFKDPAWQRLGLRYTRYFIRYDAMSQPKALASADAFVKAARTAKVRVLLHISTDDFTRKQALLPSVTRYRATVGPLIAHFRALGVTEFGAWNEANNQSQPTYRSPARAAQFYVAMRSMCKGCTIVALDALDQGGVAAYIGAWFKALPASLRTAKMIVGIHNYADVNRFRTKGTKGIIAAVRARNPNSVFWLTETGGLARFDPSFPCDLNRQKRATDQLFRLVRTFDAALERAYLYNWRGTGCEGFDSGLVNADGSLRPAYRAFRTGLAGARRR